MEAQSFFICIAEAGENLKVLFVQQLKIQYSTTADIVLLETDLGHI